MFATNAAPLGASATCGAIRIPSISSDDLTSSSTARTPSATKSPRFYRAFQRLRSRAKVSNLTEFGSVDVAGMSLAQLAAACFNTWYYRFKTSARQ
jgi:hypothetical protein